jgi:hypothetical protein
MRVWLYAYQHLQDAKDGHGAALFQGPRQGVTFPLADALGWLMAARCQILDVVELERTGAADPSLADGLAGLVRFMEDLAHVQTARASGEVGRICAELLYGYAKHPEWDDQARRSCYSSDELEWMEGIVPGIGTVEVDVIGPAGDHPHKAGPCARCLTFSDFAALRVKLDACLTGSRLAKDRAAEAVASVMIPEALDYPS